MLLRRGWPLLALLACSGPGPSDAGGDARIDAGADAGFDAGADTGIDAGRDAGTDAGHDGGSDDPGWEPWVTLEGCTFERATNPARVVEVAWEPCPAGLGPPGCLLPSRGGLNPSEGWFDGGMGYFDVIIADDRQTTVVLVDVAGNTLGAWRHNIGVETFTCALGIGLGGGAVALVPVYFDLDPTLHQTEVFYGPIGAVNDLDEPVAVLSPGVLPQHVAVSSQVVAFWTGYSAIGVDPVSGRWARLNGPLSGTPQNVQVVGSHVLWEDWADLVRVAHADLTTTGGLFHRADPGDIKGFRTDGRDFAWFEGFDRQPDGRYGRLELWSAPYVRDPVALEPRRVRSMDVRNGSVFGGGWYVVWRSEPRGYEIINVNDGTRRWWYATVSQDPLYVSENEILSSGLVRFDPHELPIAD